VLQHYLHRKVFTEKGAKNLATVDVYLSGRRGVIDLAARTIQRDGTISELEKYLNARCCAPAGESGQKRSRSHRPTLRRGRSWNMAIAKRATTSCSPGWKDQGKAEAIAGGAGAEVSLLP
jgi:hypothetical protein